MTDNNLFWLCRRHWPRNLFINFSPKAFMSFILKCLFEMFLCLRLLVLCLQLCWVKCPQSRIFLTGLVGIKSTAKKNLNHMVQKQLCGFRENIKSQTCLKFVLAGSLYLYIKAVWWALIRCWGSSICLNSRCRILLTLPKCGSFLSLIKQFCYEKKIQNILFLSLVRLFILSPSLSLQIWRGAPVYQRRS